jgi:hypothetical protein
MAGMIVDARKVLDHFRDARQRPQIGWKTVRPRSFSQRLVQLLQLLGLEPRFPSRATGSTKSRGTTSFPLGIPATYTLPADV